MIRDAPSTTWLLVTMTPSLDQMKPEPSDCEVERVEEGVSGALADRRFSLNVDDGGKDGVCDDGDGRATRGADGRSDGRCNLLRLLRIEIRSRLATQGERKQDGEMARVLHGCCSLRSARGWGSVRGVAERAWRSGSRLHFPRS
jgi:hypothetical protein